MVKNSRGKPDALLTFSLISVLTVLGKVLLNGATIGPVHCGTIDAALIGAVLVPTVGAYTVKRVKGGKPDAEHGA